MQHQSHKLHLFHFINPNMADSLEDNQHHLTQIYVDPQTNIDDWLALVIRSAPVSPMRRSDSGGNMALEDDDCQIQDPSRRA